MPSATSFGVPTKRGNSRIVPRLENCTKSRMVGFFLPDMRHDAVEDGAEAADGFSSSSVNGSSMGFE